MSARNRAAAAAIIIASSLVSLPAFAQASSGLSVEEQVAAQNFNGIDISDSLTSPANTQSTNKANGEQFSNSNQNPLVKNMTGVMPTQSSQNMQFGQVNQFANSMNITGMNSFTANNTAGMNGMNASMNGIDPVSGMSGTNAMNGAGSTSSMNGMNGGMNSGMNNGMNNSGNLVQTIGNTIMSDPKMMQRAVGVAGAATIFGLFVGNGGIGGMMRSAGMDNTRHIRGPGGGF